MFRRQKMTVLSNKQEVSFESSHEEDATRDDEYA